MFYVVLLLGLIIGYISGSVSYARFFARVGKGIDITEVGNRNPGTSNVMREAGPLWGSLTLLCDSLKGMVMMILFRYLFFLPQSPWALSCPFGGAGFLAAVLIGIAAIYGHAFPIFYKFKGGGSIGVLAGCWFYFMPPQFLLWVFVSMALAAIFFQHKKYPVGQMMPTFFVSITPVFILVESLVFKEWHSFFPNSALFSHIGWGNHFASLNGHGWVLVVSVFIMILAVVTTNLNMLKHSILSEEGNK